MASYRIVDGQRVLVNATQRPTPLPPPTDTPAGEQAEAVQVQPIAPVVDVKPLAGLAPAINPSEEPSNGG